MIMILLQHDGKTEKAASVLIRNSLFCFLEPRMSYDQAFCFILFLSIISEIRNRSECRRGHSGCANSPFLHPHPSSHLFSGIGSRYPQ